MAFGRKARQTIDPRTGERLAVQIPATARLPDGAPVPITIQDLSISGFRAKIPLKLQPGMLLRIGLPTGRSPHALVVRALDESFGCAFMGPLDPAEHAFLTGE